MSNRSIFRDLAAEFEAERKDGEYNPSTDFSVKLKALVKESDLEQVSFIKSDIRETLDYLKSMKFDYSSPAETTDAIAAVGMTVPFVGAVAESAGLMPKGTMGTMINNMASAVKLAGTVVGLASVASKIGYDYPNTGSINFTTVKVD